MVRRESAVRATILDATERLLADRRFDEITVADILVAADVARGSFYFNFESKHDVLAELVTRAIGRGHSAARSWLSSSDSPGTRRAAVRQSIGEGAQLWAEQAPVLRAIVENWRADPKLTELWLQMMGSFTAVTVDRISEEGAGQGADVESLSAALTWLGERLYYLAAVGVPPFDDQEKVVDVLTHIWMAAVYGSFAERPPG
jgi:AcrR family transcriptional regulator